jgi:hypothetical protein
MLLYELNGGRSMCCNLYAALRRRVAAYVTETRPQSQPTLSRAVLHTHLPSIIALAVLNFLKLR